MGRGLARGSVRADPTKRFAEGPFTAFPPVECLPSAFGLAAHLFVAPLQRRPGSGAGTSSSRPRSLDIERDVLRQAHASLTGRLHPAWAMLAMTLSLGTVLLSTGLLPLAWPNGGALLFRQGRTASAESGGAVS